MWRIRDVYPGSRIRLFSIPDPGSELSPSRIPDPGSSSKNLSILTPKKANKWFLSSKKYDPGCSSRIRMLTFSHPGSRIQGSKRHQIPDPGSGSATLQFSHPLFCCYISMRDPGSEILYQGSAIRNRGWTKIRIQDKHPGSVPGTLAEIPDQGWFSFRLEQARGPFPHPCSPRSSSPPRRSLTLVPFSSSATSIRSH